MWIAAVYNMVFLGVRRRRSSSLFARPIVGAFTSDPRGRAVSRSSCLRIVSLGFLFYAYGMVLTQAFNGAGDTWTPTLINLVLLLVWEIPLAYVLAAPAGFGPAGVFWAGAIGLSSLSFVSAWLFRRGKWKTTRV